MLVLLSVRALVWYMTPPSDASLQRRFYKHRADYEQLVSMMSEDVLMDRIAADFTHRDDDLNDWVGPKSPWIFSAQRWNQYREIFRRAAVPEGTSRDASDDIEIIAWTAGLAIAGESLSYVHCGKNRSTDLEKAYLPCIERKETGEFHENDVLIRYKRIEGDWYIYEFSN